MEPLFFKAENLLGQLFQERAMQVLQWSRFFSKRKIYSSQRILRDIPAGFNGAAFFQSGKWAWWWLDGYTSQGRLQWSRFFSKRKIEIDCRRFDAFTSRFNGAAFFQSGKW